MKQKIRQWSGVGNKNEEQNKTVKEKTSEAWGLIEINQGTERK